VNEKDPEHFKQEQAKLYFEADSATGTPKFYWFNDAQDSTDLLVAETTDFERVAGETEDLFTLTVDVTNNGDGKVMLRYGKP
jgi:hypothetical protein